MRKPRTKLKDTEIVKRLKAETPTFFKKLRKLGLTVTSIGGLLTLFPLTAPIGITITSVGGAMVVVSSFAKKENISNEDLEKLKSELETIKNK